MAPNTSHIRSHKHGLQDHPWELTWPCPLPLSAGVCPEQTGPLSIGNSGGLRSCCLAGAEGAAGCQWSVPAGASGNGVTLTNLPPHPHTNQLLGSGPGCRGRKKNGTPTTEQLDSLSWMSSFWPPSKQEASQAPLTSELSPWSQFTSRDRQSSSSSSTQPCTNKALRLLRFNQGQSDDRKSRDI